ncbi:MAG: aminotransferase class I/II-fold pyridoxal phosphate-dependent enzyme [Pseudomonadota bacterium]
MKINTSKETLAFRPFAVEQFLSECEHGVTYNFSESGVHPMRYGELIELAGIELEDLLAQRVDYPQVNGNELLRDRIAALYNAATASNVLVTVGATEANTLVANTLLESGDNLVCFSPTYEQLAGNAHNRGHEVRWVPQREEDGWAIDLDALASAVDSQTRLIHLVNPNNPTGRILSQDQRDAVIAQARRVGAWIVADEVYAGTERDTDVPTPSFWGCYERVVAINSTSKAYGLPGLRLGWLLAPESLIGSLWRRHEYASIAASDMSMRLTSAALVPEVRDKLTFRARTLIRRGFETLASSLAKRPEIFSVVPPQASAMSFVRYQLPISSEELVGRLLLEEDMLVVPGAHFGREHHIRFSSALPEAHLSEGLKKLHALTDRVIAEQGG